MEIPNSINDLWGKPRVLSKKGMPTSERASLLAYFIEHARDRKGKIEPARMGFMLSHVSIGDLYHMQKVLKGKSGDEWNKIFWGMLRVKDS